MKKNILPSNLISDIKNIILQSKEKAIRSVDFQRTLMYWHIGKRIFEEEQNKKKRAEYGTFLIQQISEKLQPEFGIGFSVRQIHLYRQFYRTFPILPTPYAHLSWSQFKLLLRLDSDEQRDFYIAESLHNNWTVRQLERQIFSNLFERLQLSNDKESILAIARKEILPSDPTQIIKDPMVLEFLGLKMQSSYYEKDLETAIITNLQEFLLELGNGFSFTARQKRITIDGDEFYVDLVFYNRLLKCFVLIELKTHKLTHQDIGQLQMYVNYFDRVERLPHENSTIGILLCANKNEAMVKFTLPLEQKQIIASQYKLYLPTKKQLLTTIKKEMDKSPGNF
ncbi:PDDEXK nuclease domain-containing protein [Moheibacter lacus]|uniref:DUF1016 domain-containing protein n=1 Tax=Moheibacter lacus TaxID=2745851 RepID=A0A838ZKM0_9FLAO|nr:PDDEXK nuclease domain-containing protein [Moheibacter lacus]MBA5628924.1 DUF1016 domain-containing protein [Moheibacter lacus]